MIKTWFSDTKKRKYVAETKMIHIPIAEGEFFSDQEMNDYINERKRMIDRKEDNQFPFGF